MAQPENSTQHDALNGVESVPGDADMKRYWLVTLALAVLAAACGGGDDTSELRTQVAALQTQVAQPAPDRVVGVERHCQSALPGEANLFSPQHPTAVEVCDVIWDQIAQIRTAPSGAFAVWRYLEIIVRTQEGTIYHVQVPATTTVALHDEWPPK